VLMGTDVDFNPISSNEGLMPGYTGHIPHLRSNGFPGHTYKHLTRNVGATARTDCREISYLTEQRQAYRDANQELINQQFGELGGGDSSVGNDIVDYSSPVELSASEMQHAKGVWLEFHSKMEEHHKLPSDAFRKIDDDHKGFITDVNVKRMIDLMGIRISPLQLRALIKGLGCDAQGRVTVMDFRRASELSLPDALETFAAPRPLHSPRDTVRRGGGGGGEGGQEPKRLRLIKSQRSAPPRSMDSDTWAESLSSSTVGGKNFYNGDGSANQRKLPVLVFNPRADPLIENAILKNRNRAEGGRNRVKEGSLTDRPTATQQLEGGKRFGIKSVVGYKGHQPQWRTQEWDHIQNQLTLRVKPLMRMEPPRMRSLEDEIDEGSSPELREAKAAWSLIMDNFEEFKKVQTAFRLVDKDFSGVISREELRALIENALYIVTSDAAFDIIFRTIDADGSGEISFDEFAAAISDPHINLTEAVSTDENALAAIEKREALSRAKTGLTADFDVSATDQFSLYAKNETLRVHGKAYVIQNLRKKVDTKFWEIKSSFTECDPESQNSISENEFVRLVRHHLLVPEGGPGQLASLVKSLGTDDGNIDYLHFLSSFGSLGSQVQLVDPIKALKANVDRSFAEKASRDATPFRPGTAGSNVDKHGIIVKLNNRSKEQAFTHPNESVHWQDARTPGRPCDEVKRTYRLKYDKLNTRLVETNGLPANSFCRDSAENTYFRPPSAHGEVSKAQSFGLRRMYSTRIDGSTANVWDMPRSAAPGESVGDSMYGIKFGQAKISRAGKSKTKWDLVPGSVMAEAESAWKMLRMASQSAHGSMQRAFRAVDSDGSGRIEMHELRHLVGVHLNIDAEDELMEYMFHCLDRGDKGSITYNEFIQALQGPLVSKDGATALEMQDHPLDATFGPSLATQRPPNMHAKDWDTAVTRAAKAGDRNLSVGASTYQFGDRHAWKAMNMYETSAQRQTQEVKAVFSASQTDTSSAANGIAGVPTKRDAGGASILGQEMSSGSLMGVNNSSSPTMAAYARQAGVSYVDLAEPSY